MLAFLEKTWFLWWIVAVVAVTRWMHAASCDNDLEAARAEQASAPEAHTDRSSLYGRTVTGH